MTDSLKSLALRVGLIVLLVVAVYGNSVNHGFVWDDNEIIANNSLIDHLQYVPRYFLTEDKVEEATGYYRPLTYISFALDRAIWGSNPVGYHFTNLLLQICSVLLFYAAIKAMFMEERLAFVAALIFALHPIAGETVNFLSGGRNTLLSACFALLSLLFYTKNKQIPAVVFFVLAIFSKEFALLMPAVFLLYDYLKRNKFRLLTYISYAVATTAYLILRSFAVQNANFFSAFNVFHTMAAPYLVERYGLNMIFPIQLKTIYDIHPRLPILIFSMLVGVFIAAAIYIFRKNDRIFFPLCWFLLFLLPVIDIIPINSTSLMADRYAYFSLMGFALCMAAIICKLDRKGATMALVLLLIVYVGIDIKRNSIWKDEVSLFTRMTQDAPRKSIGFRNLGLLYYMKGDIARAADNLELADSKPDITVNYLMGDAYIFWKENMLDKVEKSLLRVEKLDPAYPEPYLLLAMIYEQKGDPVAARRFWGRLKELDGDDIDKILTDRTIELCRTGETYLAKKKYTNAEIFLWQVLRINPRFVPALIDMGSLKAEQGDFENALKYLSRVQLIDSMNVPVHYNLAVVYRMQGRSADAQQEMIRFREAEEVAKRKGGQSGP